MVTHGPYTVSTWSHNVLLKSVVEPLVLIEHVATVGRSSFSKLRPLHSWGKNWSHNPITAGIVSQLTGNVI